MTDPERILRAIKRNATARVGLEAKLNQMRELGDALIVKADAAGVPKLQLARAAQLTRQTIYTILLRNEAKR